MARRPRLVLTSAADKAATDLDQRFADLLRDDAGKIALARGAAQIDDADLRDAWRDLLASGTRPTLNWFSDRTGADDTPPVNHGGPRRFAPGATPRTAPMHAPPSIAPRPPDTFVSAWATADARPLKLLAVELVAIPVAGSCWPMLLAVLGMLLSFLGLLIASGLGLLIVLAIAGCSVSAVLHAVVRLCRRDPDRGRWGTRLLVIGLVGHLALLGGWAWWVADGIAVRAAAERIEAVEEPKFAEEEWQ